MKLSMELAMRSSSSPLSTAVVAYNHHQHDAVTSMCRMQTTENQINVLYVRADIVIVAWNAKNDTERLIHWKIFIHV